MRLRRILPRACTAIGAALLVAGCGSNPHQDDVRSTSSAITVQGVGASGWSFTSLGNGSIGVSGVAVGATNGPLVEGVPTNGTWIVSASSHALSASDQFIEITPPVATSAIAIGGGASGHAWTIDTSGHVYEWTGSSWTARPMPSGIAARPSTKSAAWQSTIAVDANNNAYVVSNEQQEMPNYLVAPTTGMTYTATGNYTIWKYTSSVGSWNRMAVPPPSAGVANFIGVVGTQVAVDPTQSSTVWTLATSTVTTLGGTGLNFTFQTTTTSGPTAWNANATSWNYACTTERGCDIAAGGALYNACASYLAVGPDNTPWILDCTGGNGGVRLDVLPAGGSSFVPITTSSGANVFGLSVALNPTTGYPWYTDWNGNLYQGFIPSSCTPSSAAATCGSNNCGYVELGCGQSAFCGNSTGTCTAPDVCAIVSGGTAGTCQTCPSGTVDESGSCVACGANMENPCATSTNGGCNTGTVLEGNGCFTCGGQGQIPCAGNTCPSLGSDSTVTSTGVCSACGTNGTSPCPQITTNNGCVAGTVDLSGVCTSCGASGQLPCATGCNAGLENINNVCGTCSGGLGYVATGGTPSGGVCETCGLVQGNVCVACGGLGNPPCQTGSSCQNGLVLSGNNCALPSGVLPACTHAAALGQALIPISPFTAPIPSTAADAASSLPARENSFLEYAACELKFPNEYCALDLNEPWDWVSHVYGLLGYQGSCPGDTVPAPLAHAQRQVVANQLLGSLTNLTNEGIGYGAFCSPGNADMGLMDLLAMIYTYGPLDPSIAIQVPQSSPLALSSATSTRLVTDFLVQTGEYGPYSDLDCQLATIVVPTSENHTFSINIGKYLTNQILNAEAHGTNPAYDNVANGLRGEILGYLHGVLTSDFYEYNSIPYQEYTIHALLNLADFASDPTVATAARATLLWADAKFAAASSAGRRNAPFRRRPEYYRSSFTDVAYNATTGTWGEDPSGGEQDFEMCRSLVTEGQVGALEEVLTGGEAYWGAPPDCVGAARDALEASAPPKTILDLAVNKGEPYMQTFSGSKSYFNQRFALDSGGPYGTLEFYDNEGDFTVAAGGVPTDPYGAYEGTVFSYTIIPPGTAGIGSASGDYGMSVATVLLPNGPQLLPYVNGSPVSITQGNLSSSYSAPWPSALTVTGPYGYVVDRDELVHVDAPAWDANGDMFGSVCVGTNAPGFACGTAPTIPASVCSITPGGSCSVGVATWADGTCPTVQGNSGTQWQFAEIPQAPPYNPIFVVVFHDLGSANPFANDTGFFYARALGNDTLCDFMTDTVNANGPNAENMGISWQEQSTGTFTMVSEQMTFTPPFGNPPITIFWSGPSDPDNNNDGIGQGVVAGGGIDSADLAGGPISSTGHGGVITIARKYDPSLTCTIDASNLMAATPSIDLSCP